MDNRRANYLSTSSHPACQRLTRWSQNEEAHIAQTVKSALPDCRDVIVVDGGSTDATVRRARKAGARVVASAKGRARQMNAGAGTARGDVLLFLHADTTLPPGFGAMIRQRLQPCAAGAQQAAPLWGAFCSIQAAGLQPLAARLLRAGVELRTRLLHRPYGDQGIFVEAATFRSVGGYRSELHLLEDVDLVARLRRRAGPPALLPAALSTSGRRWLALGLLRTTLVNQAVLLGSALGVDARTLADWYEATGRTGGKCDGAACAAVAAGAPRVRR